MASSLPDRTRRRFSRWLGTRRRRLTVGGVAALAAAGVVIAVAEPFGTSTPSGAGVTDNAYPTSTTTVRQGTLSSQTTVSATLGYAGSYTVAIPSGTAASEVTGDQQTVNADEAKVAIDEAALSNARATASSSNASTMLSAEQAVTSDESALKAANAQLVADERLGCPPSSSATVTTAVSGSSSPSSGSPSSGSSSPGSSSPSSNGSTPTGNTGGGAHAHLTAYLSQAGGNTGTAPSVPSATTGSVDQTTNTATTLMGTVNPDGSDTSYYFQYGASPNYGKTTSTIDAGSGTSDVAVSAALSGLTPGATYHYRLVAKNSLGIDYGQDGTFTTNAPPLATTGSASTVTATSESLAGTVDPNGVDTSYHFEWGTSAAFGHTTPVTDVGAGDAASSVSATITGLKPGKTYDFALVATSALGTSTGVTTTFQTAESSCVAERLVISEDEAALTEAKNALEVDRLGAGSSVTSAEQTLSSDQASLAAARQALSLAEGQAANPNTTFTSLPTAGKLISRGETVYSLGGQPVPLFYGTTTLYRALYLGVGDGPDVAELQQNLIALGFGSGITASEHFSSATEQAVKAWQRSIGVPATGVVAIGDVVVAPGSIQVDTVSATAGATANAGTSVLTATSTDRVVTISLDASQQSEVKVGDRVTVTLPNNTTTPGVVSSVGTVATVPSSSGGGAGNTGGSTPTITVEVTLTNPKATGNLDQAPVEVAITNASVSNALYVPVDALLATSSGAYALEEIEANGSHQLVAVSLGLFDNADGLVQVSGSGVSAGQKIVIPGHISEFGGDKRDVRVLDATPVDTARIDVVTAEYATIGPRRLAGAVPVLEVDDVTKTYPSEPPVAALRGVSFSIEAGELVAIVGPSGSGKTTLLHLMGTLDRPTTGSVRITGVDVAGLSDRELSALRATRIGFVFQQFFLAEHQSALDNVADGLLYAGVAIDERHARGNEALDKVGLAHRGAARPTQLSGGERQRVAIARALAGNPAIVLADEPTGNLDSVTSQSILALLEGLNAGGATIVVITHEREIASRLPRQIKLLDGRIVADAVHTLAPPDGRAVASPATSTGDAE